MLHVSTSGINAFFPSSSHPNGQVRDKQVFCIGKHPRFNGFQSEGEKPSKRGRVSRNDFQPKEPYLYQALSKSG